MPIEKNKNNKFISLDNLEKRLIYKNNENLNNNIFKKLNNQNFIKSFKKSIILNYSCDN